MNFDLLETVSARTLMLPLPSGPDHKYVPIRDCVFPVQKALEDPDGPRVVTVYGVAGMGKTSLVKYVSKFYQFGSPTYPLCFPDGVVYLFCGKGVDIKHLQLDLLCNLGFAATPSSDLTGAPDEGEAMRNSKLRLCLMRQNLLIILDELCDGRVLERLLVPGKGLKYLVTTQMRSIWDDAEMIELRAPTMAESRQIMANYTEGLPKKGEFPKSIQRVTDRVITQLEHHPLALSTAGLAIRRRRVTDTDAWQEAFERVFDEVRDELFQLHHTPDEYQGYYPRPLASTMMQMVNTLNQEAQRLLFLMALLDSVEISEELVKLFYKHTQPTELRSSSRYITLLDYLEDRSLVIVCPVPGIGNNLDKNVDLSKSRYNLIVHRLTALFIRKKKKMDLQSIADKILTGTGSTDDGPSIIQSGDTEDIFVLILGAMYFEKFFVDVIRTKLKNQVITLNDDEVTVRRARVDAVMEGTRMPMSCSHQQDPTFEAVFGISCLDL